MQVKVDEKLLWSPSLCYKKALELKIKYNSNLTEDCIEEMLFEMNKVYCAKEDTALKRF
jgi:rRNA-processing protein FCF1